MTAARSKGSKPLDGPDRLYAFADEVDVAEADDTAEQEARIETWVTFGLAGEEYALPVSAAREILRVGTITRVPHAPYTVRGVVNVRGKVLPVIDFRLRLGLGRTEVTDQSRILVTSSRNRLLGLLVDSVDQVAHLDLTTAEPPPEDVMTEQSQYIMGVCQQDERMIILLDVERVLLIPDSLEAVNRSTER